MTTTPQSEKVFSRDEKLKIPKAFIFRRLHSALGFFLVIYLFEHLLVNSQAAFFFQEDAAGFISMVNKIHALPYLKVIEVVFLGLPFLIHGILGIKYALTSKTNSKMTDGTQPALPQYRRNRAFTWQRITSWVLLIAIAAHVIHMRFLEYPIKIHKGVKTQYLARVNDDSGLPFVAAKLNVRLFNEEQIEERREEWKQKQKRLEAYQDQNDTSYYRLVNETDELGDWVKGAEKKPLKKNQVIAAAPSAGAAFYLIVREAFKNPVIVVLYSILVIASAHHALNGVWTFLITWGISLTRRSQRVIHKATTFLMWLVAALGLVAAWGTYWTTLFSN